MPSGSPEYTIPIATPDTIVRGATCRVRLGAELDGSPATPSLATCALWSPTGSLVATGTCTIEGSWAVATFAGVDLPSTLPYGPDYQLRWSLTLGGVVVEARRQCALAPYELACPVGVGDLLAEYPSLAAEFGGGTAALGAFVSESWRRRLEQLFADAILPSRVVTPSALRAAVMSMALYLVFKALFRQFSGVNRWETLMSLHREEAAASWPPRLAIDVDDDGVAEGGRRSLPTATVYPNARGNTRLRRDNRW